MFLLCSFEPPHNNYVNSKRPPGISSVDPRRRLTSAWNFIMTLDRSGYAIGIGKVGYPIPYQGWLSGELVRDCEGLSYIRPYGHCGNSQPPH